MLWSCWVRRACVSARRVAATAYEIMRWAEYIGLAASLIAIGSTLASYRGRKWMGTIVSVLALIVALSAVAIPLDVGHSGCRRSTTSRPISITRPPSRPSSRSEPMRRTGSIERRSSRCCRRKATLTWRP